MEYGAHALLGPSSVSNNELPVLECFGFGAARQPPSVSALGFWLHSSTLLTAALCALSPSSGREGAQQRNMFRVAHRWLWNSSTSGKPTRRRRVVAWPVVLETSMLGASCRETVRGRTKNHTVRTWSSIFASKYFYDDDTANNNVPRLANVSFDSVCLATSHRHAPSARIRSRTCLS